MQEHIKKLAVEAGFGIGHAEAAGELFERFAQAVARDVIRAYYEASGDNIQMPGIDAIRARFGLEG